MRAESVVFAIAGAFFGLIVGWMLGSQQAGSVPSAMPPAAMTAAQSQAPPLDEGRVRELTAAAEREREDPRPRAALGNLYFDAERFAEAARWYEEALRLDPNDPNVSTDLGVSYYYTNQPDRALRQFDESLKIDPKHTKTLLNVGIVRAFGKQDLEGAAAAWQQVVDIAPETIEGQAAKRALDGLRSAHPEAVQRREGATD
jgi:cytochrome c-type biogenesis protein CcmH/NrfG